MHNRSMLSLYSGCIVSKPEVIQKGLRGDQGIKGDLLEADFSALIGGISSCKDSDHCEALKMK